MSYASEVLADSPAVFLQLDDLSGAVTDEGTAGLSNWSGFVTSTNRASLIVGGVRAWGFVVGNNITTYDSPSFGSSTPDFAVECWAKFDHAPDGSTSDYGLWQMGSFDNGYLSISQDFGAGPVLIFGSSQEYLEFTNIASYLFDGLPHHIVFVYSASIGYAEVFFDGESFGTLPVSNTTFETFSGTTWGSANFGSWGVEGTLDELAIYTYALDSSRILAHANAGRAVSSGALSVTISAAGSLTPNLRQRRRLAAPIAGTSSITAPLRARQRLAATIATSSSITAPLRVRSRMAASIAAAGALSPALRVRVRFPVTISGLGTLTPSFGAGKAALAVTFTSAGTLTVPLRVRVQASATISGSSSIAANLRTRSRLGVTIASTSTIAAPLRARMRFAATISSAAVLTPSIRARTRVGALLQAAGALSGTLSSRRAATQPQPQQAPNAGRIGRAQGGSLLRPTSGRITGQAQAGSLLRATSGRIARAIGGRIR